MNTYPTTTKDYFGINNIGDYANNYFGTPKPSSTFNEYSFIPTNTVVAAPAVYNQGEMSTRQAWESQNSRDFGVKNPFGMSQEAFNPSNTTPSWFSKNLGNISQGIDAAGGLANIYFGIENLNEGRRVNNHNINLSKANLANSAQVMNSAIKDRARTQAAGMSQYASSAGEDPAVIAARRAAAEAYMNDQVAKRKVKGTV